MNKFIFKITILALTFGILPTGALQAMNSTKQNHETKNNTGYFFKSLMVSKKLYDNHIRIARTQETIENPNTGSEEKDLLTKYIFNQAGKSLSPVYAVPGILLGTQLGSAVGDQINDSMLNHHNYKSAILTTLAFNGCSWLMKQYFANKMIEEGCCNNSDTLLGLGALLGHAVDSFSFATNCVVATKFMSMLSSDHNIEFDNSKTLLDVTNPNNVFLISQPEAKSLLPEITSEIAIPVIKNQAKKTDHPTIYINRF